MHSLLRLLVCNVLLACCLTACSTPATRAHTHAAAFARVSSGDQQLARRGQIRLGMSREAVYVAWGEPDSKAVGSDGKSGTETWVYRQRVTLLEPPNSYDYYGPYHGFGAGWAGRGFLPDCTYGGVGYEGVLRYQPHLRSLDSIRIAEFSGGRVDRFKNTAGTWTAPRPTAKAITHRTHSAPRPPIVVQTDKAHGSNSHVSHVASHGHSHHPQTAHAHHHTPGKAKSRTG